MPHLPRSLAAPALALLLAAPALHAQECGDGRPRTATLGVGVLQCVGGSCAVNVRTRGGWAHQFSTEPRVWEVAAEGPAARALSEGDVLVSVDGALITTPEGGRRLANLRAGVPVALGVRRGARELEVRVTPAAGCNDPALVMSASPLRPRTGRGGADAESVQRIVFGEGRGGAAEAAWPPVRFGIEVDCGRCGWRREEGGWRWHAQGALPVKSVAAGGPAERAGVRAGDVLVRIAGHALGEGAAGWLIAAERPEAPVQMELRRDGRTFVVSIAPEPLRDPR